MFVTHVELKNNFKLIKLEWLKCAYNANTGAALQFKPQTCEKHL